MFKIYDAKLQKLKLLYLSSLIHNTIFFKNDRFKNEVVILKMLFILVDYLEIVLSK